MLWVLRVTPTLHRIPLSLHCLHIGELLEQNLVSKELKTTIKSTKLTPLILSKRTNYSETLVQTGPLNSVLSLFRMRHQVNNESNFWIIKHFWSSCWSKAPRYWHFKSLYSSPAVVDSFWWQLVEQSLQGSHGFLSNHRLEDRAKISGKPASWCRHRALEIWLAIASHSCAFTGSKQVVTEPVNTSLPKHDYIETLP